ncbi:helix-turn-helix domain-containing protein [Streptomyces sp. NPDC008150]|uniref:helix-turn-helix domain-containing protein n=1 Tax=Streptomyces sp. NPDC008150 TaxID=3364816 RepID=UPI0036E0B4D0
MTDGPRYAPRPQPRRATAPGTPPGDGSGAARGAPPGANGANGANGAHGAGEPNGGLATSLRTWRERLAPADLGLPVNGRRRTRGLRREELAMLAGVSADYVVRLEQGRAAAPSAQVCAALARALQLTDDEQTYLFRLAGHVVGARRISGVVPSSVRRLLDRTDEYPVAVYDAMWSLLLWNPVWTAVVGDPAREPEDALGPPDTRPAPSAPGPGHARNALWRHFVVGGGRWVHAPGDEDPLEVSMVADLRMSTATYPDDPRLAGLIADLCAGSERFRTLWDARRVADHEHAAKVLLHPEAGRLELDCDVLAAQRGDLRIVMYTAEPHTESAGRLARLAESARAAARERVARPPDESRRTANL